MTFCFIIDTNPSMGYVLSEMGGSNASSKPKFSAIDIAKCCVESFVNMTLQIPNMPLILAVNGVDRSAVKSSLGYPLATFEDTLKNLTLQNDIQDFSYILSLSFSLYNKYRLKNGIDRFGYGLSPWLVDPFNVVLFTNREGLQLNQAVSLQKSTKESQSRANLSEMINEAYRWDQHIYLIVIADDDDVESTLLIESGELATLCRNSGGEIFRISSLKSGNILFRDLASKVFFHHPTVTVKAGFTDAIMQTKTTTQPLLLHMTVPRPGEWVIPESYIPDLGMENLKPRNAQPLLTLSAGFMTSPGIFNHETNAGKILQFAKSLEFPMDVYEVCPSKVISTIGLERHPQRHISIGSYIKKHGFSKDDKFFVSIQGSSRMDVTSTVHNLPLVNNPSYPFAIFGAGGGTDRKSLLWEITVFPFNFPRLLSLVKKALEKSANVIPSAACISDWRQEFHQYLSMVPIYCLQNIVTVLQKNYQSLKPFFAQGVPEHKLHKTPFRRILRAQEVATADVIQMERVTKECWPDPKFLGKDVNVVAIESSTDIISSVNLPKSVYDINPNQLLEIWETMRGVLYGSSGLAVQGFSLNTVTTSSKVHYDNASAALFNCVGANHVNEKSIKVMSDYRMVLARREALRDPSTLNPDPDENSINGLIKRKFDVNFGSRFKKSSKQRNGKTTTTVINGEVGMDIEGISGLLTAPINREDISKESDNTLANAQLFFMDTPHPYNLDDASSQSTKETIVHLYEEISEESEKSSDEGSLIAVSPLLTSEVLDNTSQKPDSFTAELFSESCQGDINSGSISPATTEISETSLKSEIKAIHNKNDNNTPALPPGWSQNFSSRYNRVYWFNMETGQSVWDFPT